MFTGLSSTDIIFLFASVVIGIVIHEMMHAFVALKLGDTTAADQGRVTLNPLASVDPLTTILIPFIMIITIGVPFLAAKPVPFNPDRVKWDEYGAALVALAGPFTNFMLAVVGAVLFTITAGSGGLLNSFAYVFVLVNVGIMVFNLIPFPPLDGSRVLYAFAPEPVQRFMETIESYGYVSIIILLILLFTVLGPVYSDVLRTIVTFLLRGAGPATV